MLIGGFQPVLLEPLVVWWSAKLLGNYSVILGNEIQKMLIALLKSYTDNNNKKIQEAFRKLIRKKTSCMFLIYSVGDGTGNVLLGTVVRVGSADIIRFSVLVVLTARWGQFPCKKNPTM
jgi:hypothetical protein